MQKVTDQSKMQQISTFLERMDDDHDGQLKLDDVLKVRQTAYSRFTKIYRQKLISLKMQFSTDF